MKKLVLCLTFVSIISAMPVLCAYGQDEAVMPETADAAAVPEVTETAEGAASVTVASGASDTETGFAFEKFYFQEAAFAPTAQSGMPAYRRKYPVIAMYLSVLCPGAGQFYNGQIRKGITMTALAAGGLGLGIVESGKDNRREAVVNIGLLVWLGTYLWSIIDAPISASQINHRNTLMAWNIGEGVQLKLHPDLSYENPMKELQLPKKLHYGLSFRIEF